MSLKRKLPSDLTPLSDMTLHILRQIDMDERLPYATISELLREKIAAQKEVNSAHLKEREELLEEREELLKERGELLKERRELLKERGELLKERDELLKESDELLRQQ